MKFIRILESKLVRAASKHPSIDLTHAAEKKQNKEMEDKPSKPHMVMYFILQALQPRRVFLRRENKPQELRKVRP